MQQYLEQLLADIRQATENLPVLYPFHIDHPMPEELDWITELAKVPFKTIAEWTGIPLEALPPSYKLTGQQVETLVEALEKLWEAYHFEFNVTKPMPPDLAYEMMLDCWEDHVQYLPLSGCDVELCHGNYRKCRMGEDCFCLHGPPNLEADELGKKMQQNMENYLHQLHTDILAGHRPEEFPTSPSATFEEEMEEMERLVLNEPEMTFGQYCSLLAEQFPPAERLTEPQLHQLNKALHDMMFSWGVMVEMPGDLPPDQQYHWRLKALDEPVHLMQNGFTDIHFCEYDQASCPFGEAYCTCAKQVDEWEHNRLCSETHERVQALLEYIRERLEALPESLEFQAAVEDFQHEETETDDLIYKPFALWLEFDLSGFPAPCELTMLELSALSEALLSLFDEDDELAQAARSVGDPERRYKAALEYYTLPVHHDGMGHWHFKPVALEEQLEALKKCQNPLDAFIPKPPKRPPTSWDGDEGSLPF